MTDEMEADELKAKAEECRRAFKAAAEAVADYCGLAPTGEGEVRMVEVGGMRIEVPEEIEEIAHSDPELTEAERIRAIKESSWAQHEAGGLCEKLFGATGNELESCIDRVSTKLAEGMLD